MKPPTFVKGFSCEDKVEKMPYNFFGRTGLHISKLSIGSVPFAGEIMLGAFDTKEAEETLITAIREGINYVDCAPHYGLGNAETFLGHALKRIPREAFYISTKVGRFGNKFNFTAAGVTESFEKSLERLQLDSVDIVIIHDVEFADSIDIIVNETIPQVKKFVESGKARFVGISGYPVDTLIEIVERSNGAVDCVLSYCRDTLIDNTLQEYLPRFEASGAAVFNAGCVGVRLLTNTEPPKWHPASQELKNLCKRAADYCKEKGVELGALAMYHSFNQPVPCTHIVGMNDLTTLRTNLRVLRDGISEKEREALKHIQKEFFTPDKKLHWEGVELALYRSGKL